MDILAIQDEINQLCAQIRELGYEPEKDNFNSTSFLGNVLAYRGLLLEQLFLIQDILVMKAELKALRR